MSALSSLASDGSCEWSTPLPEPTSAFDIAAHSAVNGVVLRNDNAVRLFDLAQGSEQWSFPGAPAAFLVPAANEGPAVYVLGFSQGGTSGGVARIQ